MVVPRPNFISPQSFDAAKRGGFVALALAAIVFGTWVGEDFIETPRLLVALDSPTPLLGVVGLLLLWCAVGQSWRHTVIRVSAVALLMAALGSGFWAGTVSGGRAFNECVEHGEEVRQALAAYRAVHGQYPPSLAALDGRGLPCQRMLHGNLLSYESDGTMYRLDFRDRLYDHRATDSSAFMGHK